MAVGLFFTCLLFRCGHLQIFIIQLVLLLCVAMQLKIVFSLVNAYKYNNKIINTSIYFNMLMTEFAHGLNGLYCSLFHICLENISEMGFHEKLD